MVLINRKSNFLRGAVVGDLKRTADLEPVISQYAFDVFVSFKVIS